jgi:hypothetical protein
LREESFVIFCLQSSLGKIEQKAAKGTKQNIRDWLRIPGKPIPLSARRDGKLALSELIVGFLEDVRFRFGSD